MVRPSPLGHGTGRCRQVLRARAPGLAQWHPSGPFAGLTAYFGFLELRHKVEIHRMTGRVVECPIDEVNRPRGPKDARLRIPPTEPEMGLLFTGRRDSPLLPVAAPSQRQLRQRVRRAEHPEQGPLRISAKCDLAIEDVQNQAKAFFATEKRIAEANRYVKASFGSSSPKVAITLLSGFGRRGRVFDRAGPGRGGELLEPRGAS